MAAAASPLSSLDYLRSVLEQRFPDATPVTHRTVVEVATGIRALDEILPGHGLPRGRLSVWMPQSRGGGATAILRSACHSTIAQGERAVWIDTQGVICGDFWEQDERTVLVRPSSRLNALRCAEELMRCGGFTLMVLAGAEPHGTELVRLSRAAREGGTAFIAFTPHTSMASLRLSSRMIAYRWRRNPFGEPAEVTEATIRLTAQSLGWNRHVEIPLPVGGIEQRMALEGGLVDRRGTVRKGSIPGMSIAKKNS